ncbi:folate-binding protein YgfZ [Sciscionella marina]|uniref:CAF17-like 4Fe-4S cluster assembly/insertion protein YgfZ n=1 Tax=Sciscionella marina TaxID=508770 RepID=UPI0004774CC5
MPVSEERSVSSPLLELPGAIANPDDSPDHGVAWHFGDPFGEQRTAARSAAVLDRSHRGVIAVTGDDRFSWLNLLTSQLLTELPEGSGTEALVLDSHGRVEHHAVLAHLNRTVYLDNEPGRAEPLREYLESMKFWSAVETSIAELGVLTLLGPEAGALVDFELPDEPYAVRELPGGQGLVRAMPGSYDLLVPRAELVDWWRRVTEAGVRPTGTWTYEALRVEGLRARLGVDTDERTIPHEARWVPSAVHLDKGCYRGQETVSKVQNVGQPPRRLMLLHLDGSPEVLPQTGDPVLSGTKTVGRVGTVITHHELGPIALALLKRSAPVDGELIAGAEDRAIQAAVDPDSIPAEHVAPGKAAAAALRGK